MTFEKYTNKFVYLLTFQSLLSKYLSPTLRYRFSRGSRSTYLVRQAGKNTIATGEVDTFLTDSPEEAVAHIDSVVRAKNTK